MDWRHTGRFCFAAFMMDFATGMFMVAVPFLALSLGATSMDLGVLGSLRGGGYVVACALVSFLCDRYDRRLLIGVSLVALAAVYLALGGASRLWHVSVCMLAWAVAMTGRLMACASTTTRPKASGSMEAETTTEENL